MYRINILFSAFGSTYVYIYATDCVHKFYFAQCNFIAQRGIPDLIK